MNILHIVAMQENVQEACKKLVKFRVILQERVFLQVLEEGFLERKNLAFQETKRLKKLSSVSLCMVLLDNCIS